MSLPAPRRRAAGGEPLRRAVLIWLVLHALIFSADLLAPHPPEFQDRQAAGVAPSLAPSESGLLHPLGTDRFGRDVLSRVLHGARLSVLAGLAAAALAVALGTVLGVLAGYAGGRVDGLVMRLCELTASLPWLYLLLGIRALLPLETPPEKTLFYLAGLIGLLAWPQPARLVRGVAAAARRADFVTAARGFGAPHRHLIRRHLLPQVAGTALTQLTLLVPACVLAEVVLSFF
ncbi:MAG: ABC transporter permease, partial [Acidobacteriota bacterium]